MRVIFSHNQSSLLHKIIHNVGLPFETRMSAYNARQRLKDRLLRKVGVARPDDDKYLTFQEATYWYRYGTGEPLIVNAGKLDLSKISAKDFSKGIGSTKVFNLFSLRYMGKLEEGLVYGNITLKLVNKNFVTIKPDIYNFDMKKWRVSTFLRNIFTFVGKRYAGKGTPFKIYFVGVGKIRD